MEIFRKCDENDGMEGIISYKNESTCLLNILKDAMLQNGEPGFYKLEICHDEEKGYVQDTDFVELSLH